MSTPEENIKTILAAWLDALRRHDFATVERRMDPEVFWQGVREDFVCTNREEAMEMLREQQREEHGVEALELIATEEKVVLRVRSTQLQKIGGVPLGGQIFQVFTLHDGRIVRVDEYRRRGAGGRRCRRAGRLALGVTGLGPRCAGGLSSHLNLRKIVYAAFSEAQEHPLARKKSAGSSAWPQCSPTRRMRERESRADPTRTRTSTAIGTSTEIGMRWCAWSAASSSSGGSRPGTRTWPPVT